MPIVIGGDDLPSPVRIGFTDLQNVGGGGQWPPMASPVTASLGHLNCAKSMLTITLLVKLNENAMDAYHKQLLSV